MIYPRSTLARVGHWLADRIDVRRKGASVFQLRYWRHRLGADIVRAGARRLEADR